MKLDIFTATPPPAPPPERTFHLALTEREAALLYYVAGSIGGTRGPIRNELLEPVHEALKTPLRERVHVYTGIPRSTDILKAVGITDWETGLTLYNYGPDGHVVKP